MCSATTGCAPRAWRVQAWACPLFLLPGGRSGLRGKRAARRAVARTSRALRCESTLGAGGWPRSMRGAPEGERRRSRLILSPWARAAGWSWSWAWSCPDYALLIQERSGRVL